MALSGRTILQVIPDLSAGGAERTTAERLARIRAALRKPDADAPISSID